MGLLDDASSSGELCFLWYRSGELDKRLAASSDGAPIATRHVNRQAQGKSEGWRLLPSAQAGSSLHSKENGKYAFVLESAHNATPLGAATATCLIGFGMNGREYHGSFDTGLSYSAICGILAVPAGLMVPVSGLVVEELSRDPTLTPHIPHTRR